MNQSKFSNASNQSITKPIKLSLYNMQGNQRELQDLNKIHFINQAKPHKSLPKQQVVQFDDFFFNDTFRPKIGSKHLVNNPKFLFSLERKKLRIKTGVQSKNVFPSQMQRTFFKGQKLKKQQKINVRCKHTNQKHISRQSQWSLVPTLPFKQKAQMPHFLFNIHHMFKNKSQTPQQYSFYDNFAKGSRTKYYGSCTTQRSYHRQIKTAQLSTRTSCSKRSQIVRQISDFH